MLCLTEEDNLNIAFNNKWTEWMTKAKCDWQVITPCAESCSCVNPKYD